MRCRLMSCGGQGSSGACTSTCFTFSDPASDTVTQVGSMNIARCNHAAARLTDGRILVVGGIVTTTGRHVATASAELYNPATNTWAAVADMSTPRSGAILAPLDGGRALVAGGQTSNTVASSTEIFQPAPLTERYQCVNHNQCVLATGPTVGAINQVECQATCASFICYGAGRCFQTVYGSTTTQPRYSTLAECHLTANCGGSPPSPPPPPTSPTTRAPTAPSLQPTAAPTRSPSPRPTTARPTAAPTQTPTLRPTPTTPFACNWTSLQCQADINGEMPVFGCHVVCLPRMPCCLLTSYSEQLPRVGVPSA